MLKLTVKGSGFHRKGLGCREIEGIPRGSGGLSKYTYDTNKPPDRMIGAVIQITNLVPSKTIFLRATLNPKP